MQDLGNLFAGDGPRWRAGAGGEEGDGPGDASRRRRILVVDDDPDARDAIVELLETEGLPAVGAANGEEALSLLRGGLRPPLMLVDLTMPVMDGWQFCTAVGGDTRWADIPIAIVTASATVEGLPARRSNAGLFIKPINVPRLLDAVRKLAG